MITFRPFQPTPDEYEAIVAVRNAVWPNFPGTVEETLHEDQTRDPKHLFERWVAIKDGAIVANGGYGDERWAKLPDKYFIYLEVVPDHRRQGIGGAFYEHLMGQLAVKEPAIVVCGTLEDRTDAIRFLEKRGFVQEIREPVSELDLAKFDWTKFEGAQERVAQQGIVIKTLAELSEAEPAWKRKLFDLEQPLLQDIPSPDPITPPPFEEYEREMFTHPAFNPNGNFIALDGDDWVGYSSLWVSKATSEKFFTGLTGVIRSHRRKGIAKALKLRAIAFAQESGAKLIATDNEENNPMFQINLQLGFEPKPAWLGYRKVLKENEQ